MKWNYTWQDANMKIFGTAQPFVESKDTSFKIGRLVANYDFFISLFKYSDFDEFHIFCPTYANCILTQQRIAEENLTDSIKNRVKVMHIASLKQAVAANDYHVFHLGGWGYFFPGMVNIRNKCAKTPFPITGVTHSLNSKEASYHALKVCTAQVREFDSIVCTSACGKRTLENYFSETSANFPGLDTEYTGRLDVIPLGIDDAFRADVDKSSARKALGIDDDAFVMLTLGRIASSYKMDLAPYLTAVKRFIDANPDRKITLVLAGGADTSEQKLLNDLISERDMAENVKLFLNFEDDKKSLIYAAADTYVAPIDNFQETFGLSVLEAMAHRCAVVVSDFNGYAELVDQDQNGIKIPVFWAENADNLKDVSEIMNFQTYQLILSQSVAVDMDAMGGALQEMLDDPKKRALLGENGRISVENGYFWSDVVKRYCGLWDELSEQAKSSGDLRKSFNPWEIDYFKVFSHYPSQLITDELKVKLSDFGSEVLESGDIPGCYSDVSASVILPELVMAGLKLLQEKELTASEFVGALQKCASITEEQGRYYLLWMMKYNCVSPCETERRS